MSTFRSFDVERHLAGRLHRVAVEEHAGLARDLADLGDGLDGAHLVVAVHDRDQDGVGPDGLAHVLGIHQAAAVHRDLGELPAALLQILHGLEHRVVLDGGGDEVLALLLLRVGSAEDGPVVGLGAAAGEVDLVRFGADDAGDGLPGLLHGARRTQSQAVDGRRVAVILGEVGEHRLHDLRVGGGGGRVVEIDRFIHETSSDS